MAVIMLLQMWQQAPAEASALARRRCFLHELRQHPSHHTHSARDMHSLC
jgi:hypothetical protein